MTSPMKWKRKAAASVLAGMVLAGIASASFQPGIAGVGDTPPPLGDRAKIAENFENADQVMQRIPAAVDGFDGRFPGGVGRPGSSDDRRAAAAMAKERAKARFSRALAADPSSRPERGGRFERGYAGSLVVTEWMCSWEGQFLDAIARDDKVAADEAIGQLGTFYDLNYTKKYVEDPSRAWEQEVLKPALRGSTLALAQEYELTCSDGDKA
jgi:hypothetical protein